MSQRDYKSTLHLPQTSFPMQADHRREDPEIIERWRIDGVYATAMKCNEGAKKFILHVGPPYANGSIHLGHAYNGILKDIITKARRMIGYHVPVIPGWDCHGLPIELKVAKEEPGLDAVAMKRACRRSANHWINVQREEFRRLGIIMDWDNPYITMSSDYEAAGIRAFGELVQRGFIARKYKTVAWCISCATTLATAEIEYHERKDPSLYVLFSLKHIPRELQAVLAANQVRSDQLVSLLVWTTTPWTLPLNRAVAVHPDATYAVVRINDTLVIVGAACVEGLRNILGDPVVEVATLRAQQLTGALAEHPFDDGRTVPILFDTMVGVDDGTACVHIAPACGPEDYELGIKQGLEIYGPVTADGKYSAGIMPALLEGMSIQDAQGWVIKSLVERHLLLHKTSLRHSYPHCWRCHQGLIYRATKQWFFELRHDEIQVRSLAAIDAIVCNPARGANFLRATVGNRWEWCLSRQRTWGIPIPALVCDACDKVVVSPEMIAYVAQGVAQEGIEFWDSVTVEQLAHGRSCEQCHATMWRKEQDILDVWFDSGISHYAVLRQRPDAAFPADLYLEGIDQYRGWYQSSLLTSMALSGVPPMKSIMTHGFTVDEHGEKMSKSKGNVIAPTTLMDRFGVDGIRVWVSSIDHEHDVVVSEVLLKNVEQVLRKVRNTMRFLMQNCFDVDPERDLISYDALRMIDRLALLDFVVFHEKMRSAYLAGNITALFHGLADYCTTALSAVYCDLSKDRLYVAGKTSHERRSAQTVLYRMLDALTKLTAPIFSSTAEQIAQHYRHTWTGSVHVQRLVDFEDILGPVSYEERDRTQLVAKEQWFQEERAWWAMLLEIRSIILKAIEPHREQGKIKHSLQAAVTIHISADYQAYAVWQEFQRSLQQRTLGVSCSEILEELCIVSRVVLADTIDQASYQQGGVSIMVTHAAGVKCPRCWRWQESQCVDGLCQRCVAVVG